MKPISLTLYRFGSFRQPTTFYFPDGPGLYFLRGENREEPALEANGAGKSTLWNAICWLAFDRTVKGLRAGDVASWGDPKGAYVRMVYEDDDGVTCEIQRQHSPNKWLLSADGEDWVDIAKDPSNPFLEDLRLALEPFLNCVLMGQGRPMFIDLGATKKAELFSDVLGLDVWLERSTRATKKANEQDGISRELERKLAGVEGQLREIDTAALEGSASEWKAENDQRYARNLRRYDDACESHKAKKKDAELARRQAEEARSVLRARTDEEDGIKAKLRQAAETAQTATIAAREGERWLDAQSEALAAFRKRSECAACHQKVPHEHRDRVGDEIQVGITAKAKEQIDLWSVADDAKGRESDFRVRMEEIGRAIEEAQRSLRAAEREQSRLENDVVYLDKDLDRLEDELEAIAQERNPFASMRQEALDREAGLQARRDNLQRQLDASNERHYLLSRWARWFKELRLKRIDSSLEELEIEVNSNVEELGLHGWALRFEVDRETQSGKVSRGFNVLVQSPHNEKPVPWEAWSGGEGQRLRIATQEGLADLIRARTGAGLDLEVWDEPTEHLSGQGVTDLLDSLAARARREKRQIWVVDHRALGYGAFTDVFTVVKDSEGSHFEQST